MNADWSKVNAGIGKKENRPPEFTHLTSTDLAEVRFLRHQGWSMGRIAKRLGRSTATIHRALEWEREEKRRQAEQKALAREMEALTAEKDGLLAQIQQQWVALEALKREVASLQQERETAHSRLQSLTPQMNVLAQERERLAGEIRSLESRKADLEKGIVELQRIGAAETGRLAQALQQELIQAGWIPPGTVDAEMFLWGVVGKVLVGGAGRKRS